MSRESETASAVEMWEKVRGAHHAMMEAGDEMARLLRESNPSIISNGSTEPAAPAVGEDRLLLEIIGREQRWRERAEHELKVALADLARLKEEREAQPAPVVGEDEALLEEADQFCIGYGYRSAASQSRNIVRRLATRLRAAMADVARLKKDLRVEKDYTESAYLAAREAGEACGKAHDEANEARAALAAAEADAEKLRADFPPAPPLPTAGCDCLTCKTMLRQQARAGRNDG